MVRALPATVNAAMSQHDVRESGRDGRRHTLRELKCGTFSLARIAKQLPFHAVETVRRGEKPIPFRIANHDAGCL